MTLEEQFNIFKEWLIPQLEFKNGAISTKQLMPNGKVECSLSITLDLNQLKQLHELQKQG